MAQHNQGARGKWNILADGFDPITKALDGFEDAVCERLRELDWASTTARSISGLFADIWTEDVVLDVGRIQRGEAMRVWLQQNGHEAVSAEINERRLKLIARLQAWQAKAGPVVQRRTELFATETFNLGLADYLGEACLGDIQDRLDERLDLVFRDNLAWGTMIVSPSKGRYCLKAPDAAT